MTNANAAELMTGYQRFRDEVDAAKVAWAWLTELGRNASPPEDVQFRDLRCEMGNSSSGDKTASIWINGRLAGAYSLFRDQSNWTVLAYSAPAPAPTTPAQVPGEVAEIEKRHAGPIDYTTPESAQKAFVQADKDRATLLAYIRTRSEAATPVPPMQFMEQALKAARTKDEADGIQAEIDDAELVAKYAARAATPRLVVVDREALAKWFYDRMPFDEMNLGNKPDWVPGGNSFRQDEARTEATAILAFMGEV